MESKRCRTLFPGPFSLSVTSAACMIPPLAERVHSLLTVPSARNAHARKSNVANVPDALFSSPHMRYFRLFFGETEPRFRSPSSSCYTFNVRKNQMKKQKQVKKHGDSHAYASSPEEILLLWFDELRASDRAKGTIRCYKSAVKGFLGWYARCEQRHLTFATLTPDPGWLSQ